jgi:hypothetical protein
MVTCPMCEHVQESGDECSLCGRRLLEVRAPDELVPRMDGLDPTRLEMAVAPGMDAMEDLEPTMIDVPAAAAATEELPTWIERTAREPASAVAVEPLAIEHTASTREDASPRDLLALPICRYCRTPASPGEAFCARCGLKLAVYAGGTGSTGAAVNSHVDVRRCRFCGAAAAGHACPECGARFAVEA